MVAICEVQPAAAQTKETKSSMHEHLQRVAAGSQSTALWK